MARLTWPYMMMYSDRNQGMNDFAIDSAQADALRVVIHGAQHLNYTDFGMITPLFQTIGFTGSIDQGRMETILNAYLVSFFDHYLLGKEVDFSPARAGFTEVEVMVK